MTAYSVLDLCPVPAWATPADALRNTVALARHAEDLGYTRFWLAEHHNMPGIASSATAVVIGQVAAATSRIRVGAGGVMLPNHAPLIIAEQYGTLATLFPGRIDLGLGRAPGTDQRTAQALRRGLAQNDRFPDDVVELLGFLQPAEPDQPVRAVPGEGTQVPVCILGSSLYGAKLAAQLGLPYAFASHFAPDALDPALEVYRRGFRPGVTEEPYVMIAANVFAADTEEDARRLKTSVQLAFLNLRRGRPGHLPAPVDDLLQHMTKAEVRMLDHVLRVCATGTQDMVRDQLSGIIARYAPDEVILTGQIHDHAARLRSFEIAAQAMQNLAKAA